MMGDAPTLQQCRDWTCDCRGPGMVCARRAAGLKNAADDFIEALDAFNSRAFGAAPAARVQTWPLTEALAKRLFIAEFGHTGMTWDSLSDIAHDEWRTKAGRVLEGWWDHERPVLILDLSEDSFRYARASPTATQNEATK